MLKLEGIKKSYGKEQILAGVSLQVGSEIKALIGLNGSGKSTLLKIIAGIVPLDEGKIWIDDDDVTMLPPEKRNIGYVPQHPALFKHLTVEDNIRYCMRNGRGTEESFREVVKLLDLQSVLSKKPAELSGGYQSRCSLARALVPKPRIILMDEPLNGVDAALKEKMLPEFKEALKASGVPVLFVTHDAAEAELLAESFAVIVAGRVNSLVNSSEAFKLMRKQEN